ncbi:MAG: hypothetical protein PHV55_02155 [Candidatus Omnitrophica bacterium]|nr:hypothetical protein [Candidatus Omnitrophota bacterium]
MQNRYVGDIGDFGKYGLLRFLCEKAKLKLGVNWYFVPDETHNEDGKFISYLINEKKNHEKYRDCDTVLYDTLFGIVKPNRTGKNVESKGARLVKAIEENTVLPQDTEFYNAEVPIKVSRQRWVDSGLEKFKKCEFVFFDPDNGFEVESCSRGSLRSIKYVYYDEVNTYFKKGKSLVIYQHRDMKKEDEFYARFHRLKEGISGAKIFSLRFNRCSVREYVFVLQSSHLKLESVIKDFLKGGWGTLQAGFTKPHFIYGKEC